MAIICALVMRGMRMMMMTRKEGIYAATRDPQAFLFHANDHRDSQSGNKQRSFIYLFFFIL